MQTTGGRSGCLSDANGPQGWMTDRGEEQNEAKTLVTPGKKTGGHGRFRLEMLLTLSDVRLLLLPVEWGEF